MYSITIISLLLGLKCSLAKEKYDKASRLPQCKEKETDSLCTT